MRQNRHAGRKRLIKALALLCCVSMLVGSFAFFTDRVSQDVRASAGNIDLVFTDISSSTTGANGIRSNNEFARDTVWGSSIVRNRAVINPGDFFDLSYALMNTGSKSMDVRQQLVLTSSKPLTADAEEYQLTITGGANPTAVPGDLSGDRKSITYELEDIVLGGSAEQEDGALADPRFVVRLDFLLSAANDFAGSGITVTYKAMAKQHRNTTDVHWATWAEYETKFDQIGEADPDTPAGPDTITLSGDGQMYNKQLPVRLTFSAPIKPSRLVEVRIDGELLDPVHYIVTGGSRTNVTLSTAYLDTLDVGVYEISVVFPDVSLSATFKVEDYKVCPGRAYVYEAEPGLIAAIILYENDFMAEFIHMSQGDLFAGMIQALEAVPEGSYAALLAGRPVVFEGATVTLSADGTQLTLAYNGESQILTAAGADVLFDENYVYWYEPATRGYAAFRIPESPSNEMASSFLGRPVNAIGGAILNESLVQQSNYKIPDHIEYIGAGAFYADDNLISVDLGSGVKHIHGEAFAGCDNLTTIYIPAGLETVGEEAFGECSSLTDVYFAGTEAEWERIAIAAGNDALLNATIHFDYAG